MNNKIPQWTVEAETDLTSNLGGQWGYIKHKIGEFSREYGAKVKKAKNVLKSQIEKELQKLSLNLNDENKFQYKNLQEQLNEIIENEVKGVILRSLCDDYEKGEKCTKYFFSLEKYRAKQKTISRLKLSSGAFTSDQQLILNACRLFYKKLYSKNFTVNPEAHPDFFTNADIPKLDENQKQFCDTILTEDELLKTLKNFSKNKSPGLDGLTAEFYIKFWTNIK